MIVDVILVGLAPPGILADHVQVSFSGFHEFLILFEGMFLKSIVPPCQQFEHTRIFFSIPGGFPEDIGGKVYLTGVV